MAVQTSYPGVYIDEFAPGAPIQGVGTGTAAFVGIASGGDLDEPTKLTSYQQFLDTYGEQPVPGFYLWYAVRGFFANGGQVCYVVRASNGAYATLDALARDGSSNLLHFRARQPGAPATAVTVEITAVHLLGSTATRLYQPAGSVMTVGTRQIELNAGEGVQFRPGDHISINANPERPQIASVSGDTLRFTADLTGTYAAGNSVRLADATVGTRTLRIEFDDGTGFGAAIPTGNLEVGSVLNVDPGGADEAHVVESVQLEFLDPTVRTYRVTLRTGLAAAFSLSGAAVPVQSEEFTITVAQGGAGTSYTNLSIDAAHPRYFRAAINDDTSGLVTVEPVDPPPPLGLPLALPADLATTGLAGGAAENLAAIANADFTRAIDTLAPIDDVNLLAIPERVELAVQQAAIAHCELLADRFAVLDPREPGIEPFGGTGIETERQSLASTRGYAALYYPWLRVPPSGSGEAVLVPPSGHICGAIANTDAKRGVFKAPANVLLNDVSGVERMVSDVDQGQLNLQGINVVRVFGAGGRPTIWGARTTATDANWQYVNIRRLFLYLEESIAEGIHWAVFEPNNLSLWKKLKRTIGAFLRTEWRNGALFGETEEDAFYVRIDEELNPFSEQALGRLHIEIGVRPTYPAEFVIVHIGIWDGGSEVTEG